MPTRIVVNFIFLFVIVFLANSCAKMSTPSGGPRDRTPPVVVKEVPENGSRNFTAKSFSITFDEYVTLDNINDKLLVSPPLKKKPTILKRGKSVIVEFEEELRDSTTYTFYFMDAIKDLNEGNVLDNYQFVFSTGNEIDSLSVTGNVLNSFTLDPPEKAMVLLYRSTEDTAVIKQLPDYIGRVGNDGYFRVDNLRSGIYKLYAIEDTDNSKNFNLQDEAFAFLDSSIIVTVENGYIPVVKDTASAESSLKNSTTPAKKSPAAPIAKAGDYKLFLFKGIKKDRYLTGSSRDMKYKLVYTLSLPPDSLNFELSIPESNENAYFKEMSRFGDTITVWLTDTALYSQPQITTLVTYPFTDTLGIQGYKQDTILMRYLEPKVPRSVKVKKPSYIVESSIRSGSLKPGYPVVFKSLTPFRKPDTTLIRLYETIDDKNIRVPFTLISDSTNSQRLIMNAALRPGKKYLFVADSLSLGNIFGEISDSIGLKFSVGGEDSYNKLSFDIENNSGILIVQLLSVAEKILEEKKIEGNGKVLFPLLEKGFFRIRSIYDSNGDGMWTTGDFLLHRQPEAVSYYPTEIELKPGWDVEQPWNVKLKNVKDKKLQSGKAANK